MSKQALRILILEDQPSDVEVLLAALRQADFEPDAWHAHDQPTFCAGLERNPEIIVADYALPDFGARNALVMVAERGIDVPLIVVTRAVSDEEAVQCIELGAADFLLKDRPKQLSRAIRRALETKRLKQERARVEATLRNSELRLRTIIETEPECVKIVGGDGKLVEMNPAGLAMLQATSLAQVQQRTLLEFVLPEDRTAFADLHERVMHGESGTAEFEIIGLQGARRWVETRAAPLRDAAGEVRELLGITRDITERKRAEEALRESDDRYRRMVDLSPDAVIIHQDGRFVFANAAAARILGVEHPAKLVGRSLLDFMHPDIHQQVKALWVQLYVDKQTIAPADLKMMRADGTIVYLETHAAPLDWEGRPAAQVVARDTTERKRAEQRLQESEAKYRELIEQADDGIFISDAEGNFVLVNTRGCELLGYTEAELIGLNGKATYLEDETQTHTWRMEAVAAGKVLRFERMVKRKDGTVFPAEISLKMVGNGLVQVIFHDITTRRSQEQKIARLSRIHAMLSGINSAVVRIRNRQELLNDACRIAVEHGAFRMAWIGLVDSETGEIKPAAWAGVEEGFLDRVKLSTIAGSAEASGVGGIAVLTGKTRINNDIGAEIDNPRREEAIKRGYRSAIALPLLVGNSTVGAFLLYGQEPGIFNEEEVHLLEELAGDVAFALEYLANREAVDYLAYYDSLTGLANRTLLRDRLVQAVHFAQRFQWGVTVMVVDLDRFKFVNDSLGHAAGDELLKVAVGRIVACVRDVDTVARVGGDEFVVMLAGMEQDDKSALQVAQRMLERFAQPVVLEGRELFVTCSIGIASHPRHGEDGETLLKNADAAMYRAKDLGRNNVQFYTPETNARANERLSLESGLRRALERDELRLHYQPLVDLRTGEVCGLEALIRWQRPEVQIVPPAQFIPLLEETGLILPIGEWVLHTACAQNKAWQDQGLAPVRIAVNLSAHQFWQQDLAAKVQKALSETGLEPRYLELELTESMLMRNVEATSAIMFELRQIGARIALDDFGTGYSSLNYLRRFPIDTLKIDRSFVNEITSDPDSAAIADAIIAMAHSLHLTVLAEGVETQGQLAWLRARSCEQMQGYLFSKPLPAGEVEQFLRAHPNLPTPLHQPEGSHRIAAR